MRFHNRLTVKVGLLCVLTWIAEPAFSQYSQNTYSNQSSNYGSSYNNTNSNTGFGSRSRSRSRSSSRSRFGSDSDNSLRRDNYATKREKNTNRNKKDAGTSNPPAKSLEEGGVRGSEKSTVARRKGSSAPAKQKSSSSGVSLSPIKIPEKFDENALYFQPSFAQLRPGDRFLTPIVFYNTKKTPADSIDLWLKYDPAVLSPEWIDSEPLQKHLGRPLESRVWRDEGYIRITGPLRKPLEDTINHLPIIHWRAIGAIGSTEIIFEGPGPVWPAIEAGDDNLLKPTNIGKRLLAEFRVGISPPETTEPGLRMIEEVRASLPAPPLQESERVRLAIDTGTKPLARGETGLADIMLLNPEKLGIDAVQFRILYDPEIIEVLDADEENYIFEGINIFDGDFHKNMRFDQHIANRVDPALGQIDYSVGAGTEARAYASGPIARIVYRVRNPQAGAAFRFEMVDKVTGERVTDISVLGRSLLGEDLQVARQALHGAYIQTSQDSTS